MPGDSGTAGCPIAGAQVRNGAGKWWELLPMVVNTSEVIVSLTT